MTVDETLKLAAERSILGDAIRSLDRMAIDNAIHEHIMAAFGYPKRELVNPQTMKDLGEEI